MDSLIADLLHITSYALDCQQQDARGMQASLRILHRRLLDAAQRRPADQEVETFDGLLAAVRVIPG